MHTRGLFLLPVKADQREPLHPGQCELGPASGAASLAERTFFPSGSSAQEVIKRVPYCCRYTSCSSEGRGTGGAGGLQRTEANTDDVKVNMPLSFPAVGVWMEGKSDY